MNAFNIAKDSIVRPLNDKIAEVLANRKYFDRKLGRNVIDYTRFLPSIGKVVGHARGGDYLLIEWEGDSCSSPSTVHWMNIKVEK